MAELKLKGAFCDLTRLDYYALNSLSQSGHVNTA